jgi:triosephosphate isomerase
MQVIVLHLCLASAVDHLEFTNIDVAAQNVQAEAGAFTGEISDMLKVLVSISQDIQNVERF